MDEDKIIESLVIALRYREKYNRIISYLFLAIMLVPIAFAIKTLSDDTAYKYDPSGLSNHVEESIEKLFEQSKETHLKLMHLLFGIEGELRPMTKEQVKKVAEQFNSFANIYVDAYASNLQYMDDFIPVSKSDVITNDRIRKSGITALMATVSILLFLVYRYHTRMAEYYAGRADAVLLVRSVKGEELLALVQSFAAENIQLEKINPNEIATEIISKTIGK